MLLEGVNVGADAMNRSMIFVAAILCAALVSPVAAAKDCVRASDAPDPTADIRVEDGAPKELHRWLGQFDGGAWQNRDGGPELCHRLMIFGLSKDGVFTANYSYGASERWRISKPNIFQVNGTIVGGKLIFSWTNSRGHERSASYALLDSGKLHGVYNTSWRGAVYSYPTGPDLVRTTNPVRSGG